MPEVARSDNLFRTLKDIERRLKNLETAPRLPYSSVDSGRLTVGSGASITVASGASLEAAGLLRAPVELVFPLIPGSTGSTSYVSQYQPLVFDASQYQDATIVFRAVLIQDAAGTYNVYAQLNDYDFPGAAVVGSEITADLAQYANVVVETADLTSVLPASAHTYMLSVKSEASGNAICGSPCIVVRYET